MKSFSLVAILCLCSELLLGQSAVKNTVNDEQSESADNIYTIREHFLQSLKTRDDDSKLKKGGDDELAEFNRWYYMTELRSYPSGKLPPVDAVLKAYDEEKKLSKKQAFKTTGNPGPWQVIGPQIIPNNWYGIGRVNCISVSPQNSGIIYIGAACGGVWRSNDYGQTWATSSDNFPSLSVADIAINPIHPDTIYAATGDGYGYEVDGYHNFWGGLYTAGIMMSTDSGNTWNTTGFSYLQTDKNLVTQLLIHPTHPNVLLASTRQGIFRSADAGLTWTNVHPGNMFKMIFRPGQPDTIYVSQDNALLVSYNRGANWQVLNSAIQNRVSIAVSPAAPKDIWIMDSTGNIQLSQDGGQNFNSIGSSSGIYFQNYYDLAIAVSPVDTNMLMVLGVSMAQSNDGGNTWQPMGDGYVHPDNRVLVFDPQNPSTFYCGNDGGIFATGDNGLTWNDLGNGLVISQIYRTSSSRQNPYLILCGLQDNNTLMYDGANWSAVIGGDGEACAIAPTDDMIQVGAYQNGNFYLSTSQGSFFSPLGIPGNNYAAWTAPVVFNPNSSDTIYFGMFGVYASYDQGNTFINLTPADSFTDGTQKHPGVTCLAVAPSNARLLYAADEARIMKSTDGGDTWANVTGNLPVSSVAISHVTVDFKNQMRVFVTMSGYQAGDKVYVSNTGGTTWTNISYNLPNIPANCIAVDSSTKGALFVGTDMGLYYMDSSQNTWAKYSTGLPNVIVDDIDINYTNYKIRAATYGRGLWECDLPQKSLAVPQIPSVANIVQLYPNPGTDSWNINFLKNKPQSYTVTVSDMAGRVLYQQAHPDKINILSFPRGIYLVDICVDGVHDHIKAVKE